MRAASSSAGCTRPSRNRQTGSSIAANYSHALWLLFAWAIAYAVLRLVAVSLKGGLRVPSPWVALLPVVRCGRRRGGSHGAGVAAESTGVHPGGFGPEGRTSRRMGTGAASYDRCWICCRTAIRRCASASPARPTWSSMGGMAPPPATSTRSPARFASSAWPRPKRRQCRERQRAHPRADAADRRGLHRPGNRRCTPGDEPAVVWRDLRLYNCSMLVTEGRYKVRGRCAINRDQVAG